MVHVFTFPWIRGSAFSDSRHLLSVTPSEDNGTDRTFLYCRIWLHVNISPVGLVLRQTMVKINNENKHNFKWDANINTNDISQNMQCTVKPCPKGHLY